MIKTNSIDDILKLITEVSDSQTLIIFDVDNVLTIPKDIAIRQNWRIVDRIWDYYKHNESIYNANIPRLSDLICLQAKREFVDKKMQDVLNYLSENNIASIALTHCNYDAIEQPSISVFSKILNKIYRIFASKYSLPYQSPYNTWAEWRYDFLKEIGIDFATLSRMSGEHNLQHGHLYNGIILTGGESKGDCLKSFLSIINTQPSKIVFIDDHEWNLQSVENTCQELKIPFYGVHYTRAEELEREYTSYSECETLQAKHLIEKEIWLSDEQANALLIHSINSQIF